MQLGLRVGRRFPPRSHARQGQREQVEPPGLSVQGRYREHDATQPVTRGGPRGRACAGKCPWPASLAGVSLLSAEVVTTSGAVCLGVSRWGCCWRAVLPGLCSGSRCVGPDARWALRDCTSGLAQLKILRVTSDALKTLITQLSFGIAGGSGTLPCGYGNPWCLVPCIKWGRSVRAVSPPHPQTHGRGSKAAQELAERLAGKFKHSSSRRWNDVQGSTVSSIIE